MAKITLAKALNHKNRLVGEKVRLFTLVRTQNSRKAESKTNYNPEELFTEYLAVCEKLVATKTAIAKANVPIYEQISRIAELKSQAADLRQIPTREGDEITHVYNHKTNESDEKIIKHVAFLKDVDVDKRVKGIEAEIEKLHDQVTAYNYSTHIEVPD